VVDRAEALRKELDGVRAAGRAVGLVPTMGSLHRGHASLIERSVADCDTTVVTIYVNPMQFGPDEDLASYPRDLDADVALAAGCGASVVFAPPEGEMFPAGPPATAVEVAGLSEDLEGDTRPGHFRGVATVVARLFNLAGPCRAYFGEKDFQQLAVVRRMVADLAWPVEVVGCPTVRDEDGLAFSSRNAYLSADERRAAAVLYRALSEAAAAVARGERKGDEVRRRMAEVVAGEPLARLDYAEVVDAATLVPLCTVAGEARVLLAAWIGGTRLIDNLGVLAR
jgi:pantoate--beta-alanine ligase